MITLKSQVAVNGHPPTAWPSGWARHSLLGTGFRPAQTGVTLLEALITLLVMSVGLLGMAALQFVGSQENASALRQSQATWLAYDMAERMRANLAGVASGAYDAVDSSAVSESEDEEEEDETPMVSCGAGDDCSASELAYWDAERWGASLSGLPGGRGTVDAVDNRLRIRVLWNDDVLDSTNADQANRIARGCPSDLPGNADGTLAFTCVEITVQP